MWVYAVSIAVSFLTSFFLIITFDYRTPEQKAEVLARAAADDDLETVTALRDRAKHALHMFEGVLVHLGRVRQLEAQSGGAMRQTANVFRSADRSDDLRCERVSHPDSFLFPSDGIR